MSNAVDSAREAWANLFRGAKERAATIQDAVGLQKHRIEDGTGQPDIAPRDAGWVELVSADMSTRYGRGHLYLWQIEQTDQLQRAELRSFVKDVTEPAPNDRLAVRPELEQEVYPVIVTAYDPGSEESIVGLVWPDTELPAALREVGGE